MILQKVPQKVFKEGLDRMLKIIDDTDRNRARAKAIVLLNEMPELAEVVGDAAETAEDNLIKTVTGGQVWYEESIRKHLANMREKLSLPGDGELEKLLVAQVVLCWFALSSAQGSRAQKWRPGIGTESADFWDRHVSRLNNDFLKACKALATVRRFPVQVNIAEKQINIAR
ncbi:hypothetical protein HKBW3S42_01190 [Candidatus Hakubella thermalkaliphila]|uniref:Uncharacterized protein n=1 Tax=Candidatus Hakubella thermalkaliphila TaxID=2754717 RepID=A0A6V8QH47_9ACTN|nr:hypothetical protein [Candidatus Hakubella thermalkaliphila]GFP28614.1 hypothetical protein HKBW3S33_02028 [Candidatus Hakubella thermalkaliphila]GFP32883.1 hypothetical protein HKBW3S42_01190 [Candidatus Hakubella thermalkaliphila]GFP44089.1 hypothetical protein HKBW3C_03221 [Candidatus Hakubella thermalkaliphila]